MDPAPSRRPRRRPSRRIVVTGAVTLVAAATLLVSQTLGDEGSPRVAETGVDEGDCRNAPCRTLGYAFRVAEAGDVVRIEGGSYGPQTIPPVQRSGRPVTLRPAGSAPVRISQLAVRGDRVTLGDLRIDRLEVDPKRDGDLAEQVTLREVSAHRMYAGAVSDFEVHGGSWGPQDDFPIIQLGSGKDVLLDGLDIHDARATNDTVHLECIWAASVDGLTLRNSHMRGCAYFGLYLTRLGGPDARDVTLENNVFEATNTYGGGDAPYVINVSNFIRRLDGLKLRNNTIAGAVALQPAEITNGSVVGNAGTEAVCHPGLRASHNVWAAGSCGPTDKVSPLLMSSFADPDAHRWQPQPGSTVIGAADPDDHPRTDLRGRRRGDQPDAGAYQSQD